LAHDGLVTVAKVLVDPIWVVVLAARGVDRLDMFIPWRFW